MAEKLWIAKKAKADRKKRFTESKVGWKGMTKYSVTTPSGLGLVNYNQAPDADPYSGVPYEAPELLHDILYNTPPERIGGIPNWWHCLPRATA